MKHKPASLRPLQRLHTHAEAAKFMQVSSFYGPWCGLGSPVGSHIRDALEDQMTAGSVSEQEQFPPDALQNRAE